MVLKVATEESEFVQIHRLNYKTFTEEIQQHAANDEKIRIDKFHAKNRYVIALRGDKVIGMVCYNHIRPFSLDEKIPGLDQFLPRHAGNLAEVRLLAVEKEERKITIAYRLLQHLCLDMISHNVDAAIISGTTRQTELYSNIGFTPFGPLVGKPGAEFQPMFITLNELRNDFKIG